MSFVEFTTESWLQLNPGFVIFLLIAFYFLFFNKMGKKYNLIGWIFISVYLIFLFNNGKPYYHRKKYGLPKAVSPHNNYWLWGYPKDFTGEVLIVIGSNLEDNSEFFEEVELAASHKSKYGMPYENVDIFICRKLKMPLEDFWERIGFFI